jgi:predicted enzyme related to lactoylglutathione lyase
MLRWRLIFRRSVLVPLQITKDSIDLGIVVSDGDAALKFYCDLLGLEKIGEADMGVGVMHRLMAGTSMIKVWVMNDGISAKAAPGGPRGGVGGLRYWTITVSNLDEMAEKAKAAGYNVPAPPNDIRPGVRITMIEDPDGNWVELLQATA